MAAALRNADRITAICHENPDADTLGAAIAICLIGERLGKQAEIVSADRPGPVFDFLPRYGQIRRRPALAPELAVVCDAATLERVGSLITDERDWFERSTIVNIDHHVTNSQFGALNLVDPTAAATCQVVAQLLPHLEIEPDHELATALLVGIIRDSHGFSDPSTTASTLRIAADLVAAGASVSTLHRKILTELPIATMLLWGRLLTALEQRFDGRVVFTVLRGAMLEDTGTQQHDADGLAELINHIEGAQVSLLLRELGPSRIRASIRTTEAVDATVIAARFGGGGHARRAGCTVAATLTSAIDQLIDACGESLLEHVAT
ncbi:MAG: DHH family phosphoesterase [Candidatus Limnocylindria bacterium]